MHQSRWHGLQIGFHEDPQMLTCEVQCGPWKAVGLHPCSASPDRYFDELCSAVQALARLDGTALAALAELAVRPELPAGIRLPEVHRSSPNWQP